MAGSSGNPHGLMTARPPATSAIEIGTELILDPPNLRLSWLRALGKRTRRVPIQFAQRSLGRVSFEQAEQAPVGGRHRQRGEVLAAHSLDRPVELEARPYRARPGAHRLLDAHVVFTGESCATEPAERNLLVVDDEAGV